MNQNQNQVFSPESALLPTAVAEFTALTSPESVETQRQQLHMAMEPYLNEEGTWDSTKANAFYTFLKERYHTYEQAGDEENLNMVRAVRDHFFHTENDYGRYLWLMQEKPYINLSMDDPRALSLLAAGEAVPRPSKRQLFISTQDSAFHAAYNTETPRVFMHDISMPVRGNVSIAVDRIIGTNAPFANWDSGYIAGAKKEDGSTFASDSGEVIRDYATRLTEVPALDEVEALITTDGSVYYFVTGGAHRAAAAIMKQQPRIDTLSIVFRKVDLTDAQIESLSSI